MAEKSKILIIGGTGHIGKYIVEASAKLGNPTFVLLRQTTVSDSPKGQLIQNFKNLGVNIVQGDYNDHGSLVRAIKQVDVVISTLNGFQIAEQLRIIDAIKEAGNVKRYLPSEFGNDVDRVHGVKPTLLKFEAKVRIRRIIEAEGIPHTFIVANCFAGFFLATLAQVGITTPPRDKVVIPGDGNIKAVFNDEHDIGTYTIKAVDDPRTLNKILYIKPPKNTLTLNEVVGLWEKKIGKTLEKEYLTGESVIKNTQEYPFRFNGAWSIRHSMFVMGDQTNFEIDPSIGVEASELYPDVKYTTVDEYLDRFV